MPSYDLYINKSESEKRIIISLPQKINSLSPPLTLTRKKSEEIEIEVKHKKKSEIIEPEDEEYKHLKETEREPLLLTDSENKIFAGRLQDIRIQETEDKSKIDSSYFVFVNTGNSFQVIPISSWYRFAHKANYETLTLEEAEARMAKRKDDDKWIMHKKREERENGDKDIDYDEVFDDDDGEDYVNYEEEEKELDVAGEEMEKLMKNYEKKSSEEDEENEKDIEEKKKEDIKDIKRRKIEELNEITIRDCFTKKTITVKELLTEIKKKYTITDKNKEIVRDFIKTECDFKIDPATQEKLLWLKK